MSARPITVQLPHSPKKMGANKSTGVAPRNLEGLTIRIQHANLPAGPIGYIAIRYEASVELKVQKDSMRGRIRLAAYPACVAVLTLIALATRRHDNDGREGQYCRFQYSS